MRTIVLYVTQLMLLAMISGSMMFFRLASQYIHTKPTLYDTWMERLRQQQQRNKVHQDVADNKRNLKGKKLVTAVEGEGGAAGGE